MWPKDFLRCSDIPLQYPIGIQGSGEDFEPLFCGLFVVDKKFIGSLYVCSQFCVGNPSSFGWVYVLRFGAVTSRENCDKTELGELWNCLVMWNCLGCLPGFVLFGGLNFHSFRLRFWLRSVKWRWNEIRNAKQQTVGFPPAPLLPVLMRVLSCLGVRMRVDVVLKCSCGAVRAVRCFWSPPGFSFCSVSPPADDFLAMQLLLSLESGSVCRTHSGQHLKHLVQKTTEVLILRWQNSRKHLEQPHLFKFRLRKIWNDLEKKLSEFLRMLLQAWGCGRFAEEILLGISPHKGINLIEELPFCTKWCSRVFGRAYIFC